MCNVKRLGSATSLYGELGIFRLIDINKYLIGRFMFCFCNNQIHALFDSFLAHSYEFHAYNTRSAQYFHIPPVKTNLCKTGIRCRGALIWNEIIKKIFILILHKTYLTNFLRKSSWCYEHFRLDINTFCKSYFKYNFCNWCVKTGHEMHSTCVCYLETDLGPINPILPPLL